LNGRGKGITKLALKKVVAWAQSELHIPRIELYVAPWNKASVKKRRSSWVQERGCVENVHGLIRMPLGTKFIRLDIAIVHFLQAK